MAHGLQQDHQVSRHRSRLHEHVAQVDAVRLPTLDRFVLVEAFDMADGLFQGAEAELGEQLAYFLGDEHEEVDHVLGLALKAGAQLRILGGNACGQVFFWQARIMTQLPRSGLR